MDYTATRLELEGLATLFLETNEVNNLLENKDFYLMLDNELLKREYRMKISQDTYDILKDFFESTHGEKLEEIDIEKRKVFHCFSLPCLEDEYVFVTMEQSIEKEVVNCDVLYTMTITEKSREGRYKSVKVSASVYSRLFFDTTWGVE